MVSGALCAARPPSLTGGLAPLQLAATLTLMLWLLLLFTFCKELLLEWRKEGRGEGEGLR